MVRCCKVRWGYSKLAEKGIDIIDIHDSQGRAVTHLHITDEDIDRAIEAFSSTQ